MGFESPIFAARLEALQSLRPPPRLTLSRWIESNLRLPDDVSALPGDVRLWQFQREIADAMSDPTIERVTLVKSVRVGLSTLLTATVGSFAANEPSPILLLLPTEADCRDYTVSDLEPIFAATPALAGLLSDDSSEGGRNTLLSRRFPGGSLKIVAAKSPRNLRRHNVRVLLIDEADAMEPGAEGSPVLLAERRTLSFANRKIIMGSTPTLEATSNVLRSYAQSDQRVFEVPCPECGTFTEILWSHIEWQPDQPETAAFRCPICMEMISEKFKPAMIDGGRWRATRPEIVGHAGFRINALVSPHANAAWGKLATEFLAAKGSPDTLQTFVNTILAQGWKEAADELEEGELQARAEPWGLDAIPPEVLAVTAGVDVQDDRLEITFIGWSRDAALILGHVVIWGSVADDSTWAELDDLLKTSWPHPGGGTLRLDSAIIDSGDGEWTASVYSFCRPRFARKIMAGKGVAGTRPPVTASQAKGVRLFLVGVDGLKSQILTRLSRGRSIRFSADLETAWYEQLASERRVVRYVRGQPVRRFERKPGMRAEALDCVVYAFAARHLVTANMDRREEELSTPAALPPVLSPVIRSKWMSR
ncbi:phage terminase large subunit family protein [Sphingobium chlorophenolicum]|uniref:Phage terminase, large subunit n=1 Tax=Sphingobium chlorophenolicum TaxID=46429 RepID=A0A081RFK0_SPHCR|nr:phage terminase large subunit family protein [Sphingobium chlorophenolicum]KEQ53973.1 Phage terminase, large subunit [Sphingobium chlorophenolicum]